MLVEWEEGAILTLDHSVERPVQVAINGATTFSGQLMGAGERRARFAGRGAWFVSSWCLYPEKRASMTATRL